MRSNRTTRWYRKPPAIRTPLAAFIALGLAACGQAGEPQSAAEETPAAATSGTAAALAPKLDPNAIPKFQTQFERLPTYIPTLVKDGSGKVVRKEFTVEIAKFDTQQLPPGFPATPLFGYGSRTVDGFGKAPAFRRTSPGPTFEQTRDVPAIVRYRNQIAGRHPLPVDPTLDWANPNNFPKPTPPFLPFPPGYDEAQEPVTHVTHTHGIEVVPAFDGTPDTWFTIDGKVGPEFVSTDYFQPSSNESTMFWYHDHSFGTTRLNVGFGLSGLSILRDPKNPLDRIGNSDELGLEDSFLWTSSASSIVPRVDTRRTQGRFSVAVNAKNFVALKSAPFPLESALGSTISVDFFLPSQQPNPQWFGAVQLYLDCPSKGVNSAFVGQVELTGKPVNTFSRLSYAVPAAVRSAIGSSCEDLSVSFGVNVPFNATGTYLLDNVRGIPVVNSTPLPRGEFEVPMVVQDRSFRTDGTVFYPIAQELPPGSIGANPDINPYWTLIFNGDTNVVNGKVWPNMEVKRAAYRFRMLNSANQRFYRMQFSNGMPFTVIGSDGGYLATPRTITSFQIGVTERVDFVVDFSRFAPGTKIIMQNTEQLQPPIGPPPDPNNDGLVMQFTVVDSSPVPAKPLPAALNDIATLTPDRPTRILIQNVQQDDEGRILQAELDGQLFHELTTELPTVGATEDWDFVNLTPLTHNKHVHLIQFLVVSRQDFDNERYLEDWLAVNGNPPFDHPTLKLDPTPYLMGSPMPPEPEESGWKDTVRTPASQVTKIRVRWNPTAAPAGAGAPGVNLFPFDPTNGIGFVWHCHLVEHEDNEMMRPMTVIPTWRPGVMYQVGNRSTPGVGRGLVDVQGVNYEARVAHTSVSVQPPPTRPDLWERINNQNGDWEIQIIYQVGDRVFFQGSVYRALQEHQARPGTEPNVSPQLWSLVL